MTLKIGDKVRFLNDIGGGTVTGFIDEKTVEVQTDDGFEIPILATELILDNRGGYGLDNSDPVVSSPKQPVSAKTDKLIQKPGNYKYEAFSGKVLMAIVPENDKLLHVSDFILYIINDSNYNFNYVVSESDSNIDELVDAGKIEADSKQKLVRYNQTKLSKLKSIHIQGFFYKDGLFDMNKACDMLFDLKDFSFYKSTSFSENEYFHSSALILEEKSIDLRDAVEKLNKNELFKISSTKDAKERPPKAKRKSSGEEIEEVDLHVEEIVENHSGMSNAEILNIQMSRFETSLETAIRAKTKKIVFIHGVGNGRLKHEIQKKLERNYPDLAFQDASFKEYGFGATMVYLK